MFTPTHAWNTEISLVPSQTGIRIHSRQLTPNPFEYAYKLWRQTFYNLINFKITSHDYINFGMKIKNVWVFYCLLNNEPTLGPASTEDRTKKLCYPSSIIMNSWNHFVKFQYIYIFRYKNIYTRLKSCGTYSRYSHFPT